MKYLYIISSDNEQNRTLFNNALINFPELNNQKRFREGFKNKTDDDIIDFEYPENSVFFGDNFLLLKVIEEQFDESMMQDATDYEIYNKESLGQAKGKYYI